MAVVSVSRWKGNTQDATALVKEAAPLLKKHGAVSVRWGQCHTGEYVGQHFAVVTYPNWETYGKAAQAQSADPDYQRLYAEAINKFELLERFLLVAEDL
jgi:hypothetical protein